MLIVLINGDPHATLRYVTGRPRSLRKILRRELLATTPSVVKHRRLAIPNTYLMVMMLMVWVVHQHATFNLKLLVVVIVRVGVLEVVFPPAGT